MFNLLPVKICGSGSLKTDALPRKRQNSGWFRAEPAGASTAGRPRLWSGFRRGQDWSAVLESHREPARSAQTSSQTVPSGSFNSFTTLDIFSIRYSRIS